MKTLALMATYQPRFTKIVWDAVMSLAPQVDAVYLTVNYPYTPEEKYIMQMTGMGIEEQTQKPVIITFLKEDLGDLAKFYPLVKQTFDADTTILTCDDDIIYPADYVERIGEWLSDVDGTDAYPFITFGGKILTDKRPYKTWKESWERRISIWGGLHDAIEVHIPLSGASAFKRCALKPKIYYDTRYKNSGDLLLASWLRRSGTTPVSAAFSANWFKYNPRMANKHTIWEEVKVSPELQAKVGALATEVMEIQIAVNAE